MCDPTGGWLTLGATLLSGAGTYVTSRNNAAIAKQNARFQDIQARDAIERGKVEEEALRRRNAALLGTQRSQLAASGVELDSGSASDLLADTAAIGELDALTIRSNALREAFGFSSGAAISRANASNARTQGLFDTGATLLTGGSRVNTAFRSKPSTDGTSSPLVVN